MRRRPLRGAAETQLLLLALACLFGVDACWGGDLPALASRSVTTSDAGGKHDPGPALHEVDAAENVIVVGPVDPGDAGQGTGEIAISLSMPIDTVTGEVAAIGSVAIKVSAAGAATTRMLTLQLGRPRQQVRINLTDVPAGGPYELETSASADGITCVTSTLPFSVLAGQIVSVSVALVCGGDAGWSGTL